MTDEVTLSVTPATAIKCSFSYHFPPPHSIPGVHPFLFVSETSRQPPVHSSSRVDYIAVTLSRKDRSPKP